MSECIYYRWNAGYYCDLKYQQTDNGDLSHSYCQKYCWTGSGYEDCQYYKKKQGTGCFLTSACVEYKQLPDNCKELQTLRYFRDEYMAKLPDGEQEIKEYYDIAPDIVAAINADDNAAVIWERIYKELIVPCVESIDNGKFETAHVWYRGAVLELNKLFLA